jgi:hypothetical protein
MRTITLYMRTGHHLASRMPYRLDERDTDNIGQVLWCENCCIDVGVVKLDPVKRSETYVEPTLDAMIKDFIANAVADAQA